MKIQRVVSRKLSVCLRSACGVLGGAALLSGLVGCGGSSGATSSTPPAPLTLTLASASLATFPAEASGSLGFTLTGGVIPSAIEPSVTGVPTGANVVITTGTTGNGGGPGTIAIAAGSAAPGTYKLTVSANDGVTTVTQPLTLTVGTTAVVSATTTGSFSEAMSTSFQIASYNDSLFPNYPMIPTLLTTLAPKHTRMQVYGDIPETADGTWDFTTLDTSVQPILTASDHSPEFQIATAPAFAFQGLTTNFVNSTFLSAFSDYSAHLVQYYNTGGFMANGTLYKSASANPIKYWGIYNEPDYNNVSAADYVTLYNTTVPAMLAVDPTIKIVALELGGGYASVDEAYIPPFVQGVKAQVDVMATHYYSSCNQRDSDATVMATVPGMATDAKYIYQQMATNPALAHVPVWVLENNVNADYDAGNGMSACNAGQTFVDDLRGSTAFFAAWRPWVFSQLGQAGVQALYHWDFAADPQYGEYNVVQPAGVLQLSYWVDYWLGQLYPSDVSTSVLSSTNSDVGDVEVMAVKQAGGEVVVMVADHAVANATDNNGAGVPRTVLVDLSALGNFTTVKQITLDATTNTMTGPTPQTVAFAPKMQVALGGYGVTFLTLQ
jgi:hypothetical protein